MEDAAGKIGVQRKAASAAGAAVAALRREGGWARQGDGMIRTAEWIRTYRERLMTDKTYGFIVVILGLVFVLAVFVFAIFKFNSASDVTTTVTSVGGVIGTIVGAFFGLQ